MTFEDLPVGTWMTWMDRGSPTLALKVNAKLHQIGTVPEIGTEVVRVVWKGSIHTLEGKRAEVRETLIYTGVSAGDVWTREHTFKKKR